jgi:Rrf2 family nitric oxide-sensitive transcriptional repressor
MLSQTAEYALRAVVSLAYRAGKPTTAHDLAEASHVPSDYLSKVLQTLGRMGIVAAQRGKRGGFTLARPADELTILDVVNSVDPVQRIHSCPLKLKSHGTTLCPLHRRLDAAMVMIEQAFGDTTIADLLNEPSTSKPLCNIQGVLRG